VSWSIEEADSVRWLREYEGEKFSAVITDPPYSSGGMVRSDRTGPMTKGKYVTGGSRNESLPDFAGDNRDQRGFLAWMSLWASDALRSTLPGGWLLVFTDWRQMPTVTDAVQAGGWVWRGIAVWNKVGGRPMHGRFRQQTEFIVAATNGPHKPWEGAPYLPGVFRVSPPRDRIHITEKPVDLLRPLVTIAPPGSLICDPFVGSGSTGEAVLREGRRFIGCELVPEIADRAAERLQRMEGIVERLARLGAR